MRSTAFAFDLPGRAAGKAEVLLGHTIPAQAIDGVAWLVRMRINSANLGGNLLTAQTRLPQIEQRHKDDLQAAEKIEAATHYPKLATLFLTVT